MRIKNLSWTIFMWIIFVDMLMSLDVWFFWGINRMIFAVLATIYCIAFRSSKSWFFKTQNNALILSYIFIVLAFMLTRSSMNIIGWVSSLIRIIPPLFIILLSNERALEFFSFFKKVLSYLLLLSIIGWVLYLLGVPLPHGQITFGEIDGGARYYYNNYYLFLVADSSRFEVPRFEAFFTEAGYLGCILSVLLFSEGFVIKKKPQNIIFLIALVLSFSLAGWLISLLGYLILKLKPSVRSVFVVVILIGVFFTIFSVSRVYNGGDNILYNYVFNRLEYDSGAGTIQGYNRSSASTADYFEDFLRSDKLLLGEGADSLGTDNVDWKSFMIRYGLLATLLVLLYYLGPTLFARNHKFNMFGVSLIFLLIAMQTTYGIFSCMYICLFALNVKNVDNQSL